MVQNILTQEKSKNNLPDFKITNTFAYDAEARRGGRQYIVG